MKQNETSIIKYIRRSRDKKLQKTTNKEEMKQQGKMTKKNKIITMKEETYKYKTRNIYTKRS